MVGGNGGRRKVNKMLEEDRETVGEIGGTKIVNRML